MHPFQTEINKIKKAGVNDLQAQSLFAYIGGIENMRKTRRLKFYLLRIPLISEISANKIINYINNEKK